MPVMRHGAVQWVKEEVGGTTTTNMRHSIDDKAAGAS